MLGLDKDTLRKSSKLENSFCGTHSRNKRPNKHIEERLKTRQINKGKMWMELHEIVKDRSAWPLSPLEQKKNMDPSSK